MIVCGPSIYKFEDWTFEVHSYLGPHPLTKKGEPRKHIPNRFWKAWSRFAQLSEEERRAHRIHEGGCKTL